MATTLCSWELMVHWINLINLVSLSKGNNMKHVHLQIIKHFVPTNYPLLVWRLDKDCFICCKLVHTVLEFWAKYTVFVNCAYFHLKTTSIYCLFSY